MSFEYPVTFDQTTLRQYREELQYTNQEVEMLAIRLERDASDMAAVEQIRHYIQESWMSSVKLDLIPVSESLADMLKGLDLLLDWQVYPKGMTEFILLLLDRLMDIAREVEEKQFIDIRKTQSILVALQYIILVKDFSLINQVVEDAIKAISQDINATQANSDEQSDVMLFDDGVDLFDDGVELFSETSEEPDSGNDSVKNGVLDIFVPDASKNPLLQSRDYIKGHSTDNCRILLEQVAGQAAIHHADHARFLLELSFCMNILAGQPLDFESIYHGICMHDLALATNPELNKKGGLSENQLDELHQHPVKSAELAHEFVGSEETELLVLHHHERMDGSGYPFGLNGSNISEQGKLAAIVDSFHDVINMHKHLSEREQILKGIVDININMEKKFDASWVKLFNITIRDYWLPDWRAERRAKVRKAG